MKFFHELRNHSQHVGRIDVACAHVQHENQVLLIHKFVGSRSPVPGELLNREVWICCTEHLAKLARIVLRFAETFPSYACPHLAVTQNGMRELDLTINDVVAAAGFPRIWVDSTSNEVPETELLRILRNHFEGIDFNSIREIADFTATEFVPDANGHSSELSLKIVDHFAQQAQANRESNPPQ